MTRSDIWILTSGTCPDLMTNACVRQTREVYELLVAILAVQMVFAATNGLKVKVRPGRTITVRLQIDAIRGDFHAQQGCGKTASFQCFLVFVPSLSCKNDYFSLKLKQ
jgi:hypothetical protein